MYISVVMAVYNGERYLVDAIDSVLNQTYPHFELVIVNDGSTDRTKEILNSITDKRVKVIHSDMNKGAATSLNIGVDHSRGDWIAIHDADDISEPTRLEEQVKYLENHPESIGVSSLIKTFPYKNNEEDYYNRIFSKKIIYDNRLFSCYLCHGTVIFSKEAFYKVGGYNSKYKISYDYDLWQRLFEISLIEKVPKVLYHYRINQNSLGKSDSSQTIAELMNISTSYIYQSLKISMTKEPRLAVLGSQKGIAFYKKHVEEKNDFHNIRYFLSYRGRKLEEIYTLYKKGEIDAVIVLNTTCSNRWVRSLSKKGMSWDVNLFKIWNYRY